MNRYKRNQNNTLSNLKDYAVPIIGLLFIIIIVWSIFGRGGNTETSGNTNSSITQSTNYQVSFMLPDTQAQVIYSGGRREDISDEAQLFSGETITVQEGQVRLSSTENHSITLNRISEFKIDGPGSYALFSSDAWIESESPVSVTMRYATVTTGSDSIISLTQNEAGSTVYVMKGSAQVENMVGVQTRVVAGNRISVPRLQASNRDFDITSERVPLDTFFQNSDWFLANDGHLITILEETDEVDFESENGEDEAVSGTGTRLIRFDSLRDEMSVDASNINVSGTLLSDNIGAISIQNIPVEINTTARSFALDNIALPQAMNDLVVKIYDNDRNIIRKEVFTVYTSSPNTNQSSNSGSTANENNNQNTQSPPTQNVTHFDADATQFRFTAPATTGRFTTTSSEITIRGETTAADIARVEVNGFRLNSFDGRSWRYHAFERFDTIREGTNQYRIDYYDSSNTLVFTDFFTIIKQAPGSASSSQNQSSISNQSTQNDSTPVLSEQESTPEEIPEEPDTLF